MTAVSRATVVAAGGRDPLPVEDLVRRGAMGALLAVAVALVAFQEGFRHLEVGLASLLFSGGSVTTYAGPDDMVVFLLPGGRGFALEITPECTAAFLIAPFAVVGAAMLLRRRIDPFRVLAGVGLAGLLLVLANQLRVGAIAGLAVAFGLERGYEWGHLIVGSVISVVFLGISAAVLLAVVSYGYRGRHEGRAS